MDPRERAAFELFEDAAAENEAAAFAAINNARHDQEAAAALWDIANGREPVQAEDPVGFDPEGARTLQGQADAQIGAQQEGTPAPPQGEIDQAATETEPTPDRRTDLEKRKIVDSMTPAEMRRALLIDELTELGTRRAFLDALQDHAGPVVAIDADSLKWINGNTGHKAGDELLVGIGRAISHVTGRGFHTSGDEFYILPQPGDDIDAMMAQIDSILDQAQIQEQLENGTVITKTGIQITHAQGRDQRQADERLLAEKTAREQRGERAGRGEEPPGVSRDVSGVPSKSDAGQQGESDSSVRPQDLAGPTDTTAQAQFEDDQEREQKTNQSPDMLEDEGELFAGPRPPQGDMFGPKAVEPAQQAESPEQEPEAAQAEPEAPKFTRAQANAARSNAEAMIRESLKAESATEVKRIAKRLLPDFGFQVPFTKSEMIDLIADPTKVNPLDAADAFTIGLSRDTRAKLRADMADEIVEPGLFREAPAIVPQSCRNRRYYSNFDGEGGAQPVAPERPAGERKPTARPGAKPKRKPSGNKVFTDDAADKARELLKKKLGTLRSGIDPETMQAGITLAGYHVEKGARSFAAFSRAMIEDLGEMVRPYLKSWYLAVKHDPRAADFSTDMDGAGTVETADVERILEEQDESDERGQFDLEPDRGEPGTPDEVGAESVRPGSGRDGGTRGPGVSGSAEGSGSSSGVRIRGHETVTPGKRGDQSVYTGSLRITGRASGGRFDLGSGHAGFDGPAPDTVAAAAVAKTSRKGADERLKAQPATNCAGPKDSMAAELPALRYRCVSMTRR
jgi:GGDEF domain-containing protein